MQWVSWGSFWQKFILAAHAIPPPFWEVFLVVSPCYLRMADGEWKYTAWGSKTTACPQDLKKICSVQDEAPVGSVGPWRLGKVDIMQKETFVTPAGPCRLSLWQPLGLYSWLTYKRISAGWVRLMRFFLALSLKGDSGVVAKAYLSSIDPWSLSRDSVWTVVLVARGIFHWWRQTVCWVKETNRVGGYASAASTVQYCTQQSICPVTSARRKGYICQGSLCYERKHYFR